MDLTRLSVPEMRRGLDAREFSAVDLAKAHLNAINERDSDIHAFLEIFDDVEIQAQEADARIAKGEAGPLTGIPIAIKDNILITGKKASAASKILENYVAPYDATVITKLKEAGVVFLGRTNMDEFAMGSSTENSAFGATKNPHDTTRVPGGSSGGSAAAVAAHFAPISLGSDTGGSVRQPAALCGVVGLKPTYGAVSRYGLIALASSLDQIGPMGHSVADVRAVYDAIKGHDAHDSTSLPDGFYAPHAKTPKVIGVPRSFLTSGVDPDVLACYEKTLKDLESQGYELRDIALPHAAYSLATYYVIQPAEASANLSRFDGIRYGLSVDSPTIQEVYEETRAQGFGPETRRRILTGTFVLSSGYFDAYYRRAQTVRDHIRADFASVFESVDAIATPTSPVPAFQIGEKSDPVAMYAADIFTVPVNLAGVPAISIPSGTVERDGTALPVGFQLIAPHGNETTLFTIGEAVEASQ